MKIQIQYDYFGNAARAAAYTSDGKFLALDHGTTHAEARANLMIRLQRPTPPPAETLEV